ncbi:MAG: 30S ribosome-binding factor RbfA [Dehalogenimonas sp.]|uniref:Ribosome-binding factor A n=1 Tax=Candidatus Dehalogenimonas loeffleri TaxID=3127115 RepID=A0ABZ2J2B6_9CHLR|nr:30S ribosome-binding factor RbfA [Dehalogenimonas sp.]
MSHRMERVNQLIREELSRIMQREIRDPRLEFLSINAVETAADLGFAKVFVSHLVTSENKKEILQTLTGAAGYFRGELGKVLTLRHVPELAFYWDDSIERGARLNRLIEEANRDSVNPSGE